MATMPMIEPRSSGVVFTVNPTSGNVHQILVSALYGAGEGLAMLDESVDGYPYAHLVPRGRTHPGA